MVLEDWHEAAFVAAAIVFELALFTKLTMLGLSGKKAVKEWLRSRLRFLKYLLLPLCSGKEEALVKESTYLHMRIARGVTHYLVVVALFGLILGQAFALMEQPFWLSIPQLWNILVSGLLGLTCMVFPSILRPSTTDVLYIAFNAIPLVALLPSHCLPQDLFMSWFVIFILVRLPSIPLASCGLTVVDSLGLSTRDPTLLVRVDMYATVSTLAFSFIFLASLRMKAELIAGTNNLSSQLSAASSLLRLTCDAVVELDSELRFTDHSPELSAMLLHDRPGTTLKAKCFTDFMQPVDAGRAIEILGASSNRSAFSTQEITAHAFHTRLVDSCSSKLCAEVFQVKYSKLDGKSYHLLGIRDFTDIKSLAGPNADSLMSSPVQLSPRSSAGDSEPDCQPKAYLDIDTEGMVVQSASQPLMARAGTACTDLFPSPHMTLGHLQQTMQTNVTMLLNQLRKEAELFAKRGEDPPMRVLSYQDMPVIFNAPHVHRITGNMQITQTRPEPEARKISVATEGHSEPGKAKEAKALELPQPVASRGQPGLWQLSQGIQDQLARQLPRAVRRRFPPVPGGSEGSRMAQDRAKRPDIAGGRIPVTPAILHLRRAMNGLQEVRGRVLRRMTVELCWTQPSSYTETMDATCIAMGADGVVEVVNARGFHGAAYGVDQTAYRLQSKGVDSLFGAISHQGTERQKGTDLQSTLDKQMLCKQLMQVRLDLLPERVTDLFFVLAAGARQPLLQEVEEIFGEYRGSTCFRRWKFSRLFLLKSSAGLWVVRGEAALALTTGHNLVRFECPDSSFCGGRISGACILFYTAACRNRPFRLTRQGERCDLKVIYEATNSRELSKFQHLGFRVVDSDIGANLAHKEDHRLQLTFEAVVIMCAIYKLGDGYWRIGSMDVTCSGSPRDLKTALMKLEELGFPRKHERASQEHIVLEAVRKHLELPRQSVKPADVHVDSSNCMHVQYAIEVTTCEHEELSDASEAMAKGFQLKESLEMPKLKEAILEEMLRFTNEKVKPERLRILPVLVKPLGDLRVEVRWEFGEVKRTDNKDHSYLDGTLITFAGRSLQEIIDYRGAHGVRVVHNGVVDYDGVWVGPVGVSDASDGAIKHRGLVLDELPRSGTQTFEVQLEQLPPSTTDIFVVVSSPSGKELSKYNNITVILSSGHQVSTCLLKSKPSSPGVVFCRLFKQGTAWKLGACRSPTSGGCHDFRPAIDSLRAIQAQTHPSSAQISLGDESSRQERRFLPLQQVRSKGMAMERQLSTGSVSSLIAWSSDKRPNARRFSLPEKTLSRASKLSLRGGRRGPHDENLAEQAPGDGSMAARSQQASWSQSPAQQFRIHRPKSSYNWRGTCVREGWD
eukprot:s224_g19.t2